MKVQPLVSIVTPVYNGAEDLAECVESVLRQTYSNWDYTIVNNCSTDETLAIAQKYAAKDPRIRVISTDHLLPIIENHNYTIRQISPESKYCKFVFGDDWLHPTCVEEMVRVAEENPTVGLVGAFTMDGEAVIWPGPSYPCHRAPGREVCRSKLLGGPYVFGTMTCLLVRSDLIRKRALFFNERNLHADQEACFDILRESDFSFVHQVLSFTRPPREQSNTSFAKDFGSIMLGEFVILLKYGPVFLNQDEYRERYKTVRRQYYGVLAHNALRIRPKQFWKYHKETLGAFDCRLNWWLLAASLVSELARHLSHPIQAVKRGLPWWSRALNKTSDNRSVPLRSST